MTFKNLLKDHGIKVISLIEPLDNTPSGRMLEGVIETMDQFYSENMGEDIKRGLRESAQRGFYTGSKVPYGLHKVAIKDGNRKRWKLEPDPEDSVSTQVVRRIFYMAFMDHGCKEIAKSLNRDGIRTGTGRCWTKTTVHKILTNEAYCGTLVLGGRQGHEAIFSKEFPIRIEDARLALIDKDIFSAVQTKLAAKRPQVRHPRTVPSFYLLSGLLFCSCGQAMIGRSAKSYQYYYYMCNRRFKQGNDNCDARSLPKDKIEQLVIEQIKTRILNDEWIEELVYLVKEELDSSYSVYHERLQVIDTELNDTRTRLSKLYDALEIG